MGGGVMFGGPRRPRREGLRHRRTGHRAREARRRRRGQLRRADAGGGLPRHLGLDARVRSSERQDARPGGEGQGQDGRRPDQGDRRGREERTSTTRRSRRLDHRRPGDGAPRDRTRAAVTELVNNGPPVRADRQAAAACSSTAATFLGMSVSDLQADAQGGQVARRRGDRPRARRSTTSWRRSSRRRKKNLDEAGRPTARSRQAQENAILTKHDDALTNLVNGAQAERREAERARANSVVQFATLTVFGKQPLAPSLPPEARSEAGPKPGLGVSERQSRLTRYRRADARRLGGGGDRGGDGRGDVAVEHARDRCTRGSARPASRPRRSRRAAASFISSLIAVARTSSAPRKTPGNASTLLIWFG